MACPSGCVSGGGQIKSETGEPFKELVKRVDTAYHQQRESRPEDNPVVRELYHVWLGEDLAGGPKARQLLHTQYHVIPKLKTAQAIQW